MFPRAIRWGVVYFAIVFAVGFALGIVRVGLIELQLGTRWAELLEMPFMLVAFFFAARWIVRKTKDQCLRRDYIAIGLIALALLLIAEATMVLSLRGMSIVEYISSRDPISGSVYAASLVLFAAMPWIASRFEVVKSTSNASGI